MHSDEKDRRQKDGKKIKVDFERKIFRLYAPELKANLTNKELPPIGTPIKKTDPVESLLQPPTGDGSDLDQANNSVESRTTIDSSDSWEVPARVNHAIGDN